MGAKSTVTLERQDAIDCILDLLRNADEETIADVLEVLNDEAFRKHNNSLGLHNFRVI